MHMPTTEIKAIHRTFHDFRKQLHRPGLIKLVKEPANIVIVETLRLKLFAQ